VSLSLCLPVCIYISHDLDASIEVSIDTPPKKFKQVFVLTCVANALLIQLFRFSMIQRRGALRLTLNGTIWTVERELYWPTTLQSL
jgi:hypothetical protein